METNDIQDKTLDCMLEELDEHYSNLLNMSVNLKNYYDKNENPIPSGFGKPSIKRLARMFDEYTYSVYFARLVILRRYKYQPYNEDFHITRDKDGKHHFVDMKTSIELEHAGGIVLY